MQVPSRARGALLPLVLVAGMSLAGCDRSAVPATEETTPASAAASTPARADASDWIPSLGTMLVVPLDSQTGAVLFPAFPSPRLVSMSRLRLVDASGAGGEVGAALLEADSAVCGEAAVVRVADARAIPWSVALAGAGVSPLPMDSLAALVPADSARTVAELARLASALPIRGDSRFKGLPFVVLSARRFELGARRVLVGHLVRRVPHEAAPVEEHTLLVTESATGGPLSLGFHLRTEGTEDVADQYDALAALSGAAGTWLIISRENDARAVYVALERASDGRWRVRWSRVLSC